jgi:hypothetical protein
MQRRQLFKKTMLLFLGVCLKHFFTTCTCRKPFCRIFKRSDYVSFFRNPHFMLSLKRSLLFLSLSVLLFSIFYACKSARTGTAPSTASAKPRILVFIKTAGFYHESIPTGVAAIQKLGSEK